MYESSNIYYQLVYHTGAIAGQMCKKIIYEYDGEGNIIGVCEIPYILTSDDLIYPATTTTPVP